MEQKDSVDAPAPCVGGCGFYGNKIYNGMCSKCFKEAQARQKEGKYSFKTRWPAVGMGLCIAMDDQTMPTNDKSASTTTNVQPSSTTQAVTKSPTDLPVDVQKSTSSSIARTPSPSDSSQPNAETISPKPSEQEEKTNIPAKHRLSVDYQDTPESSSSTLASTAETTASPSPSDSSEKPVQLNRGRCYKCRVKIPLAKQTVNKCRCNYTFCDAHRYPDRHDCDVDYAKLGRDLLAKNNPKLNERPKGGRTFQRIDSL